MDYRLAELAARLPDSLRLRGLREKYALRRVGERFLPAEIHSRPKIPYRAPIKDVFFGPQAPDYVDEVLRAERVDEAGVLEPAAVDRVVAKFRAGKAVSETDEMAVVGAISIMLLHERLVARPELAPPLQATRVVVGDESRPEAVAEAV